MLNRILRITACFPVLILGIAFRASAAEERPIHLAPSLEFFRSSFDFDSTSPRPGKELASGLALGVRLISGSSLTKNFEIGLDLRQNLARVDGREGLDILATRLGVRGDWLLGERWSVGAAWYFGDTIVARHRDRQYNGSSAALFLSTREGESVRWFLQATVGSHHEGPGFIFLSRRPGDESLKWQSIGIGVEFPITINAFSLVEGT